MNEPATFKHVFLLALFLYAALGLLILLQSISQSRQLTRIENMLYLEGK